MTDALASIPLLKSHADRMVAAPRLYRADAFTSIRGLETEWKALEQAATTPVVFQCLAWCRAWINAIAANGINEDIRLITVRRGGRMVLVWPLAVRRFAGCRILHQLAEPATQYCDALVDPREDRDLLMRSVWDLISSWKDIDVLELRRVRDDAAIAALPVIAAGRGLVTNHAAAPYINGGAVSGCIAERTSRTRNSLRRHHRKLAQHGAVEFEVARNSTERRNVLQEGLIFKRQWLRQRGLWSNGYFHAGADEFSLSLAACEDFLVSRLTVGGETAAIEAGFVIRNHYWSLIQSYDEQYASHGPGRLLMWQFIERCPKIGISRIDFLAPAQDCKREWASGEIAVKDHVIARTIKGAVMAQALVKGRPALRRLYGMLPGAARRYVVQAASLR